MGWLQSILSINLEVNLAKELHNYPIPPPQKKKNHIYIHKMVWSTKDNHLITLDFVSYSFMLLCPYTSK